MSAVFSQSHPSKNAGISHEDSICDHLLGNHPHSHPRKISIAGLVISYTLRTGTWPFIAIEIVDLS